MELKKTIMSTVLNTEKRLPMEDVIKLVTSNLEVSPGDVKRAMNELVFDGKLEFTFYGKNFVEPPLAEAHRHGNGGPEHR